MESFLDSVPWPSLHDAIHTVEEWRMPIPSSRHVLFAGVVGIPVAVLLHDTSHHWMPKAFNIPILSFFVRRWAKAEANKASDLAVLRDAVIFLWLVAAISESEPQVTPLDYVVERFSNSTARRAMTESIHTSRRAAFATGAEFINTTQDDTKARQLRDAALRRRHIQETREI